MRTTLFTLLFCLNLVSLSYSQQTTKPNILLLYTDDLRPELGCYGKQDMKTPNIDALAAKSTVFNNAFCNVAVCGASRASMLTGIRPTATYYKGAFTFAQADQPKAIGLAKLLKQNGYTTISNGKVYHHMDDNTDDWDEIYRPYAFAKNYTEKEVDKNLEPTHYWEKIWKDYKNSKNIAEYANTNNGPAYEAATVADSIYIDGIMSQKVIQDLKKLQNSHQPFFLTAGFISAHLPFNAPQSHWDKYPLTNIQRTQNNFIPKNAPEISISNWWELRGYSDMPKKGPVTEEQAKKLIQGYKATVSYVDTLIGNVLQTLKDTGLDKNTIVILVSDHGYNLEEHTQWAKFTSYKTSTKVPLMIAIPNQQGTKTNALTELVDVYPTIAELCHVQTPKNQLEGSSLVPILKKPTQKGKKYVFIKNENGYTIQTHTASYTEFIDTNNGKILGRMLYDHTKDPEENINVAEAVEYQKMVKRLHQVLHHKFKKNLPTQPS